MRPPGQIGRIVGWAVEDDELLRVVVINELVTKVARAEELLVVPELIVVTTRKFVVELSELDEGVSAVVRVEVMVEEL